ncbi:ATP-binding protein [Blastococcus sp. TF02A-30]|uniref:ATP-binding protein n=1 Tax=Blastococcus sp. TF02A-30 TaxID=2250580 RepID=UPI0013148194|nr:ATP-binding protein [Blastococcus sp. TF02A-30]
MTNSPAAMTPLLGRAGALPPVPASVGQTFTLQAAAQAFRMMDELLDITCFDGPAGTGKTTACAYAAAQSKRKWRYCVLPLRAHPRDLIATVYEAVFQRPAGGTERLMSTTLVDRLCDGDIGLIADEVHHVGLQGAQQLRYLWDAAATRDTPFPLLLVGCDVRRELARAEEVRGRIARWVSFDLISDVEDVIAIAGAQHPRLALTDPKIIQKMNERIARRSIRAWHQIGKHIRFLPDSTSANKATGLTRDDVRLLRSMLGTDIA